MKFSNTAKRVIELADQIRGYWSRELPRRHPNYPVVDPGDDSGPPPPQEHELRAFLGSLSPDDIYKLIAVMYLGREDYSPSDFSAWCREVMPSTFPDPKWAISQMMEKAPLGDYIRDGLATLARAGVDVDAPMPVVA